jgi:hypothetical protein
VVTVEEVGKYPRAETGRERRRTEIISQVCVGKGNFRWRLRLRVVGWPVLSPVNEDGISKRKGKGVSTRKERT